MTDPAADCRAELRRSVYLLLIVLSAGAMLGRILAVDAVDRAAVEQYLLKRIPGDLRKKRRSLESRGISGDEIEKELARADSAWQQHAQLRRPFLSANDRSRWCTVRALVEDDMRVEDAPYAIDKVIQQPNWDTIDMVKHDGHLYSSKPPLLPTLMAAVYWPIYRLTGRNAGHASLRDRPRDAGAVQPRAAGRSTSCCWRGWSSDSARPIGGGCS